MNQWDDLEKKYSRSAAASSASQSDPWSALEQQYALPKTQEVTQQVQPKMQPKQVQTQDLPFTERFFHGWRDPIDGGAQLLEKGVKALSPSLVSGINSANNWLADKTGIVPRLPEGGVSQLNQNVEDQYQASRGSNAGSFDGGRLLGNVINPTNVAIAARAPTGATLLSKAGIGAGSGALSAALNPVYGNPENFAKDKATQVGLGAMFGGSLPVASAGVSRLISPKASTNPQLQQLLSEGVKPTIGQTLGGWAAKAEEKLQSLPIMGDMISSARNTANDTFANAAFNRALKPVGESLPQGLKGRDAVVYTENLLKDRYNNVLDKIGAITPDSSFSENVAKLTSMVNKQVMPLAEKEKFTQAITTIAQSMDKNKVITSDAFKALESSLGQDAAKLGMSTNIYEAKLAPAVKQLQVELRDMLKRQAGSAADELQSVNSGWANFKRVQDAASKLGADNGEFSPAQFQNAVSKLGNKAAFARGSALGQDLGDAGKAILTGKVANSGTADRLAYGVGAIGAGAISPAIPVGLTAGAAAYTQPMQNILRYLATTRPAYAPQIANSIEQFGMLGAPAAGGLLQQYR